MPEFEEYRQKRTTPRTASGGIKAQSTRGRFGTNWWSRRWIEVLESFNLGGRLTRGKSYARLGQVISINVIPGAVHAAVVGSMPAPYLVTISIKELNQAEWQALSETVLSQALIASKLLAGQLPAELEEEFQKAGVTLFPRRYGDLKTHCTCPDFANPCKHIAAVYYLLAEEFDRSPFLLLTLRGVTRERLLESLGAGETDRKKKTTKKRRPEKQRAEQENVEKQALDHKSFWGTTQGLGLLEDPEPPTIALPATNASLTKQLGNVPFWRGEQNFQMTMEDLYARAAGHAQRLLEESLNQLEAESKTEMLDL